MAANSSGELKEILRALLVEIENLRVEQAVLIARLAPNAKQVDLLEAKRRARTSVVLELGSLAGKIERLP
jgi:hypothetical protein